VQRASIAAWNDEAHVRENRRLYAAKFDAALALVKPPLAAYRPDGGFYLWMRTPADDAGFARGLLRDYNVRSCRAASSRAKRTGESGQGHVRIALVAPLAECVEALGRIGECAARL